jgi:hypothetical protein
MAVTISINVTGEGEVGGTPQLPPPAPGGSGEARQDTRLEALERRLEELQGAQSQLVELMGDEIGPFPPAGVDGFLSHFIMKIQFLKGDLDGQAIAFRTPPAVQTVSRSAPFVYRGPQANHRVDTPVPRNCTLASSVGEEDFFERPAEFFEVGRETVWMQILNLDARVDQPDIGQVRIILGETLKREQPDLFKPSLGIAQSLGAGGFPARLFFNPYAIVETPLGSFRAIHGTLAYGRITGFPPVGTPVSIQSAVPLEPTDEVRAMAAVGRDGEVEAFARLLALSHPIDVELHMTGDEAFDLVETMSTRA